MNLKIFNTLTGKKEQFVPLKEKQIGMYVCGVTVYDYCHVGHARAAIVFDTFYRYFQYLGYEVRFIRNFTDIDDKIINRANEKGVDWQEITHKYTVAFYEDMGKLNIASPTEEPKATDHIAEMLDMIQSLVDQDKAYESDGDVFYSIKSFKDYGCLSGKNIDDLQSGARVEVNESKRDPLDFALWKKSKSGEPSWDSPWGPGRPGWHIECSAMSKKYLGDTCDIHGGGKDLVFPHHENEIAQSCGCTGKQPVRYWVHNGFVNIDKEKMSKSLNNFFTVREVLKEYDGEVVRQLLIASHYRSPINYSEQSLQQAAKVLERLYTALKDLDIANAKSLTSSRFEKAFLAAMDDDFNTPKAFAVLFDMMKEINRQKSAGMETGMERDTESASQLGALLVKLGGHLGLLQRQPQDFLRGEVDPERVEELIAAREQARADKDWARADQIRDQLSAMKVVVEDGADGSSWRLDR